MTKKVSTIGPELAHREAIRECLFRHCRGNDRSDVELLRSAHWPDATYEFPGFISAGDVNGLVDNILRHRENLDQTQHIMGNILIDIKGSAAHAESYFQAFHRLHGPDSKRYDVVAGGRYIDRMELRDDEWRIARRVVVIDWFRNYPDSADWEKGVLEMKIEPGGRKPNDRSYDLLRLDN